jgi:hypothetical protein
MGKYFPSRGSWWATKAFEKIL